MFLKSIKLCGFLNVKDTKTKNFGYYDTSKETTINHDNFVNIVKDYNFIQAFSYVMDAKHKANTDPTQFMNKSCKEDSYVEIHFWQNKSDDSINYSWLSKNELTLKRILNEPKVIYINNKKHDITSFHHALSNLGLYNIEDLFIHRLLYSEIRKMCSFTGEDFWKILMRIIECEELIEIAERKEGIVHKKVLWKKYDLLADTIKTELPKKCKLHEDIKNYIESNRKFFTHYYVLTERRENQFSNYKQKCLEKLEQIEPRVKDKLFDHHQKSKENMESVENVMNKKSLVESMLEIHDELDRKIEKYERVKETLSIEDIFETINSARIDVKDDDAMKVMTAAWKLILKESKADGEIEKEIDDLTMMIQRYDLEHYPTYSYEDAELNFNKLVETEQGILNRLAKVDSGMLDDKMKDNNLRLEIEKLVFDGKFNKATIDTLFEIEKIIQSDEHLMTNYLGPVYNFFDSTSSLDEKVWPQISSLSNWILFATTAAANSLINQLREFQIDTANITICCIDAFREEKTFNEEINAKEMFLTMENLIANETSSRLKKILVTLLCKILLVDNPDWKYENKLRPFSITEYSSAMSMIYDRGTVQVVSELSKHWTRLGKGPVKIMQEIYQLVKERVRVMKTIDDKKRLKEEMKNALSNEKSKIVEKSAKNLFKVKKVESPVDELRKLLTLDVDDFDEESLRKEIEQSERALWCPKIENYKHLKEIPLDARHDVATALIDDPLSSYYTFDTSKITETDGFKTLKAKRDDYKSKIIDKISDLFDDYEVNHENFTETFINDFQNYSELFIKMKQTDDVRRGLLSTLEDCNHNPTFFFLQDVYDNNVDEDDEVIFDALNTLYEALMKVNKTQMINIAALNPTHYTKLAQSISKVADYSNADIFAPIKVRKRAYPLMNVVAVKILKDTVYNFVTKYNTVLVDYITDSNLFFFTKGSTNDADDKNFSWTCFDMSRLKAIEFVENWKSDEMKNSLELDVKQRIKGFLLILFIINYISAFKFVIINSVEFFKGMDTKLIARIKDFLKLMSPHVQVILCNEQRDEDENMEIDDD